MNARVAAVVLLAGLCFSPLVRADAPPASGPPDQTVAPAPADPAETNALPPSPPQAQLPSAEPAPVAAAPQQPKPGRFFVHAAFGVNVYTYLASTGTGQKGNAELNVVPGDRMFDRRMIFAQQLGFGWFFHKNFRLTLTTMFGETATGIPDTVSKFTQWAFIPWLAYQNGGFFVGLGPLFTVRAYGDWNFEIGLFPCAGYNFKLGKGFSIGLAVQAPVTFYQRVTFAITPALTAAYRF